MILADFFGEKIGTQRYPDPERQFSTYPDPERQHC